MTPKTQRFWRGSPLHIHNLRPSARPLPGFSPGDLASWSRQYDGFTTNGGTKLTGVPFSERSLYWDEPPADENEKSFPADLSLHYPMMDALQQTAIYLDLFEKSHVILCGADFVCNNCCISSPGIQLQSCIATIIY